MPAPSGDAALGDVLCFCDGFINCNWLLIDPSVLYNTSLSRENALSIMMNNESMIQAELTIVFEEAEEGGYTAYIPEIPGVISEGASIAEAREMVLDALKEVMAARRDLALSEPPSSKTHETVRLSA